MILKTYCFALFFIWLFSFSTIHAFEKCLNSTCWENLRIMQLACKKLDRPLKKVLFLESDQPCYCKCSSTYEPPS